MRGGCTATQGSRPSLKSLQKALGGLSGKPEQLIVKLTKLKNDGEHLERDGEGLGLLVQLLLQVGMVWP